MGLFTSEPVARIIQVIVVFLVPLFLSKLLRADRLNLAGGLKRLVDRTRHLVLLNQQIARHLPPSLVPYVRLANLRDGVLVLHADSAAWRMRAHYLAPRVLDALRGLPGLEELVSVQVKVAPPAVRMPAASHPHPPRISAEAAKCLADAADTVSDPTLRDSLRRLAARGRPVS